MPSMEFFWGVEVKPGQTVSCDSGEECVLRVTQVALGETKKGSANIVVSAKIDDQKVIVGTLSAENRPQFHCDLFFEKEFELSHSSKTASVFVCGYRAIMPDLPESRSSKDEGEVKTVNNQVIEDDSDSCSLDGLSSSDDDLTDDESSSEDDSSEEDDSSSEEDDSSSEEDDSSSDEMDTSSEEDLSDEDGKYTLMKVWTTALQHEDGKKRVAGTALKTAASGKKAKIATPSGQTTGDKKVPHVSTPHPAKQARKTPGNSNSKPKAKSPKSGGTHACKSCSKTFGSDSALQSHEKAKHA